MDVFINDIAAFLPNDPVDNDDIEDVLGRINNIPSAEPLAVDRQRMKAPAGTDNDGRAVGCTRCGGNECQSRFHHIEDDLGLPGLAEVFLLVMGLAFRSRSRAVLQTNHTLFTAHRNPPTIMARTTVRQSPI